MGLQAILSLQCTMQGGAAPAVHRCSTAPNVASCPATDFQPSVLTAAGQGALLCVGDLGLRAKLPIPHRFFWESSAHPLAHMHSPTPDTWRCLCLSPSLSAVVPVRAAAQPASVRVEVLPGPPAQGPAAGVAGQRGAGGGVGGCHGIRANLILTYYMVLQ